MIAEIRKIIESNQPRSYGMIIKGNKEAKSFIDDFKLQNQINDTGEALFCLYYNKTPKFCDCGNRAKFFNFARGYWATCGYMECSNKIRSKNGKKYFQENPEVMKKANNKTQQTMKEKYGTTNCSNLNWVKDKKKVTCFTNYGYNSFLQSPEGKNQFKLSCLEKYGVKNPQQNEEVQEKTKKTCMEKYHVPYAIQSESSKEKILQTNLKKYNVEFTSQKHISEESLGILKDKNLLETRLFNTTTKTLACDLGVNPSTIYDYINLHNIDYSNPNFSSYEQEIRDWLKNNLIDFEVNTKKIISPFELDVYIPKHNLAIEFDGLYWHSEICGKDKNYHLNKTQRCEEKNIRVIHIFEDEWVSKKELCLDLIGRFLNLPNISIMARKCDLKNVAVKDARAFLNTNHLQEFASASVYLGLFYKEELIQLMSFRSARYNKKIEWENIRCCNKIGFKVVGGVKKLWKHFIDKYQPKSVVSYCDRRWFVGETYSKLGFSMVRINRPQYNYTNHQARWHRSLFTKNKCIKKALSLNEVSEIFLLQMTEKQIAMKILGLDRIWDCGQTVWVWNK
jgi:very-short-patch-repair endonuclease